MNRNKPAASSPGMKSSLVRLLWRRTRQAFILVAGVTVILIGCVLIFTPGPAIVVIPAGIAILATEFVWARKLLTRFKASVASAANAAVGRYPSEVQKHVAVPRRLWRRLMRVVHSAVAPFRRGYIDASHPNLQNDVDSHHAAPPPDAQ